VTQRKQTFHFCIRTLQYTLILVSPPPRVFSYQGAKQLYRIIVHPFLLKHEDQIDEYITKAGHTGLDAIRRVSREGINRAATTVVSSAMKVCLGFLSVHTTYKARSTCFVHEGPDCGVTCLRTERGEGERREAMKRVRVLWITWHLLPWELEGITSPCCLLIG